MAVTGTLATVALYTSLAASAISAGVSYKTSEDQKAAQEAYNKQLEEQAIAQYAELDKQEADVIETSYKESMQAQREYLKARSSVELQAAATGTYGQSIDLAITDLGTGLGQRMADITARRRMQLDNIDIQAKNIAAQAKGSSDYSINQPSWYSSLSTGLSTFQRTNGAASAAAGAASGASTASSGNTFAQRQSISAGNYDW